MSQYRYNSLKAEWVIIAPKRARRPNTFERDRTQNDMQEQSPFVYGHEQMTPSEVYAVREYSSQKDAPGWNVRVVPNKYNALDIEKNPIRECDGIFESMDGFGAHEVIIDTPKFPCTFEELDAQEVTLVLSAAAERLRDLHRDARVKYVQLFKNQGGLAGASLSHSHSQVIALPFIPRRIITEIEQCRSHFEKTERSLIVDIAKNELKAAERIVEESERFVAFCPYASLYPFEVAICSKKSVETPFYDDMHAIGELAKILSSSVKRISKALCGVSYNVFLKYAPPVRDSVNPYFYYKLNEFYQWHIEIVPRIPIIGGFELATGVFMNTVPPEEAAKFLRDLSLNNEKTKL